MRGGVNQAFAALMIIQTVIVTLPYAGGWGNGGYSADPSDPDYGTHDWVADMALLIQTQDVSFLSGTYHSEFLLGTEAPDNPEYIGDTVKHHIYYYESGALQDDVCADRAATLYASALAYLLAGDYDLAAYDMGAMAHYISDPGSFGHTMDDSTFWGEEVHHSDYEDKIGSMISSLPEPASVILCDFDAYTAAVGLASKITFGDGADIMPNTWMDASYDWYDDVFYNSAVASLHASVQAVAGAMNHLLKEAFASIEPPAPEAPGPPLSPSVSVEGDQIVLSWSPPSTDGGAEITEYVVYKDRDLTDPVSVDTVPGDTLTWTDDAVEKGVTYYYWVAARNSEGTGDLSAAVSAEVPKDVDSWVLPAAVLSVLSLMAASAGALYWRKARGKR